MPIIDDGTTHEQKTISIYSNDGTSLLYSNGDWYTGYNIEVTETGLAHTEGFDNSYDHEKSILGFATSANATEPTYAVGDTFQISADTTLYVIEAKSNGVTVEYNGLVVATVEGGNTATLPIKDKKMKSDIMITVPESSGEVLPEFDEVEDFTVSVNGADEGSLELAYSVSQDVKLSAASPAPLVSIDDANFIANNIKKDVSIFGLTGAYEAEDKATPIEVSTEAEMTALLESGEVGGVYKYTGTTGTYENGALYVLESDLITFTINGTKYQAESGMTWGEWCESDYNTGTFTKQSTYIADDAITPEDMVSTDGTFTGKVAPTDTIIADHSYSVYEQDHGGGSAN